MAADLELDVLASQADRIAAETETRRQRLFKWRQAALEKRRTIDAYRELFLDDALELRPAALAVLADISATAELGRYEPAIASDAELRMRSGRRALALHVFAQLDLDGSRLRKIATKLREMGSE